MKQWIKKAKFILCCGIIVPLGFCGLPVRANAYFLEVMATTTTLEQPNIDFIFEGEVPRVTGQGTPGLTIYLILPNGDVVETVVQDDGNWGVQSTVDFVINQELIAWQEDDEGNKSLEIRNIVIGDVTPMLPGSSAVTPGKIEVINTKTVPNIIFRILSVLGVILLSAVIYIVWKVRKKK